jgi:uncharacterized membrane protein YcjF (UPF0283 family)
MDERQRRTFSRKLLSSWVSLFILALIALAVFIIGYFLQNNLLQGLAGVLGAAALSLFVTIVTGREAVSLQNAKEVNVARKEAYYVPMFSELKQIYDRLEEARQKTLPYPQWIKGRGNEAPTTFVRGNYSIPTFTNWVTFQEEPY